ncbi:conserved transmembrane domain protein [Mycobacterium kansasii]|uniref:Conserved transmembrane domain protein n=1 Tax=Mycobacterium kansasii TaxID=1768 RepID=A0A1V3XBR8_MYCKA|nr:conserved transmembrane domain protein [Mycobacterium kansasii]
MNLLQQATAVADRTEVLGPVEPAPPASVRRSAAEDGEAYARRRRNLLIGISAGAAVLLVALLVLVSVIDKVFGNVGAGLNRDQLGLNTQTSSASEASSAPAGSTVKPTKATVFSPTGRPTTQAKPIWPSTAIPAPPGKPTPTPTPSRSPLSRTASD